MPTRRCSSCEPHPAHGPSKVVWLHAKSCSLYPGEKVGMEKTRTPHEAVARTVHPAGTIAAPMDPAYVDFWIDRDDDEIPEEA